MPSAVTFRREIWHQLRREKRIYRPIVGNAAVLWLIIETSAFISASTRSVEIGAVVRLALTCRGSEIAGNKPK